MGASVGTITPSFGGYCIPSIILYGWHANISVHDAAAAQIYCSSLGSAGDVESSSVAMVDDVAADNTRRPEAIQVKLRQKCQHNIFLQLSGGLLVSDDADFCY